MNEHSSAESVLLAMGVVSLALVAGALGFQYLGGLKPCEMCHWQRWPHIAAAISALVLVPQLAAKRNLALFGTLLALIAGLGATYAWGMLNGWQPALILGAVLLLMVTSVLQPRAASWCVLGLIALSGLIGAYQTGMQWHLLPGPSACSVAHAYVMGSNAPVEVRCDVPTWFFLGLALPAWNAIFSLLIAGTSAVMLARRV